MGRRDESLLLCLCHPGSALRFGGGEKKGEDDSSGIVKKHEEDVLVRKAALFNVLVVARGPPKLREEGPDFSRWHLVFRSRLGS